MPKNQSRFSGASTSNISDALDRLGISGACEGIAPMVRGAKVVGSAFTVRYVPVDQSHPGTVGDFMDSVKPGQVVVIDNAGRTGCTVWGDIMTTYAVRREVAGTIIDGVCRDVDGIRALGYPVFARGHFMRTGKDRVQVDVLERPVAISGVLVRPGDVVVGDDNGVVIVPLDRLDEVARIAEDISEAEEEIIGDLRGGATLADARKRHGYHGLQRKTNR